MIARAIGLVAILFLCQMANAQQAKLSTKNKKAIKNYALALEAYNRFDVANTENYLLKSIQADKRFLEAYLILSQLYQEARRYDESIAAAQKATSIDPDFFPNIYYNVGNMHLRAGRYQQGKEQYEKFLTYPKIRLETAYMARFYLDCCNFAMDAMANPKPFNPEGLGPNVNSPYDEYWPSLSADENTLVITRSLPFDSLGIVGRRQFQEDFFMSDREATGSWGPARNMGSPLNTPHLNEGAQSITADGQRMYFTICEGPCDLFYSDRTPEGSWGRPVKLPEPVNLPRWSEKQPSISPDGQTLYFVSNRPNGLGQYDIWFTKLDDKGNWGAPKNMGKPVNSPFNEQSPFIHFDNQTLYFASDGHVGMGGLDLFRSNQIGDTAWSQPINLGYPINTHADEDGMIVNAKGTTAYFASVRDPDMGRDIFTFDLYPEARPTPVSYMSGTILDGRSHWPLEAQFRLVDLKTNEQVMASSSGPDGNYFVCVPSNREYAFVVSAHNYLFYSEHFNLRDSHTATKPLKMNIYLSPLKVGQVMVMRNVFYETASWELKSESVVELDYLVDLLQNNPSVSIEVGGHTDSIGSDEDNLSLSDKRAQSVVSYLMDRGISAARLSWKGYGKTTPIADNETEAGRALNRRTEVKIVGIVP